MMMHVKLFICVLVMSMVSIGCTTKGDINGDLDGQWQLRSVERLSDGSVITPQPLYYCFYLHTVNVTAPGGLKYGGNMTYEGSKLTLDFPVTDVDKLNKWYIYENRTTFDILKLSSESLVLKSSEVVLTFRKF